MREGEEVAAGPWQGAAAGEEGAQDSAILAGTPAPGAVERASALDVGYFVRHPDRAHRVRGVVPGEFPPCFGPEPPPGWRALVAVKQIAPGVRFRFLVIASRRPCSCETGAARLWERAASEQVREGALAVAALLAGRPW